MEQLRAFIAVPFPDEVKSALSALQSRLKSGSKASVKWVEPGNIHLTLKFLGNVSAGLTGRLTDAIAQASQGIKPFSIQVKGLGVFPNLNRVNIVWVGLSGDIEKLEKLQQNINSKLSPLGFQPESRPFTPHLTIARLRDHASPTERRELGQLISSIDFDSGHAVTVDSVHLMKSRLTREGPIYSVISRTALG